MNILNHFQNLTLTNDQQSSLEKISVFLENEDNIFILQGSAGSGKTTILKGVCDYLNSNGRKFSLMSPTGRAAMVLQEKTKYDASTIHKFIYNLKDLKEEQKGDSFRFVFELNGNNDSMNAVYIVDEASMVSELHNEGEFFNFGSGKLLQDLMEFVFSGGGNRKIIFVGDSAQLPPVDMSFSPCLNIEHLETKFNKIVAYSTMKEVVRQKESSGILASATTVREQIETKSLNTFEINESFPDVSKLNNAELMDCYEKAAKEDGIENCIVITHSNKRSQENNRLIRKRRFGNSNLSLQKKDRLIITKNNYREEVVLLNGMFAEVIEVGEIIRTATPKFYIKDKGTYSTQINFREAVLSVFDPTGKSQLIKTTLIDNLLNSNEGVLHSYDQIALYMDFVFRMSKLKIKPNTDEFKEAIKTDKYFNAVQAKYGYSITCHKSQGGEWKNVFIDFNVFLAQSTLPYYRWVYTAITRATSKLFCIDAPEYNALSKFIVKDIVKNKKISPYMYYIPTDSFVEYRVSKLQELALENNVQLGIINHIHQLECTFSKDNFKSKVKLWYTKDGFSSTIWELSKEETFDDLIKTIILQSIIPETITFTPKFKFQNELNDYLTELFNELGLIVTNIHQKEWSDEYYIKTDANCAYIVFYFDKNHFYTNAQPNSTLGNDDLKLIKLVEKLKGK